uniref:BHLH domain-containing protein n=1 Tax=Esox lucius TaxID=8010 RepID=A0A6Q2XN35_ESOLU
MLGIYSRVSCNSWEMEYDCYQHYFLDDLDKEEDFYKSTAPSEDIWKKFELLPTPPMSPNRTLTGGTVHVTPGDKLGWLSKVLSQDDECEGLPAEKLFGNVSSIIIQDCMWSSFSASKHLEKVNGRLSATAQPRLSQPAHQNVATMNGSKVLCSSLTPADTPLPSAMTTECVDPAAVLTFPTTGCRKSASSGSESRSDSSDNDDEEIDVVTVESKKNRVRLLGRRNPGTPTVHDDPCPKRFHMSVHRQHHNYAAPSPDKEEPQTKRSCPASGHKRPNSPDSTSPAGSSADSPQSSDAEDTDRRKNHNYLERKRRNDLRSRFLALRDEIPGLVESAKTPKVAILTQATEYLLQLHTREKHQAQERKRLKARQQQLLRRIADLKRS